MQKGWDCPSYILRGQRSAFPDYDAVLSLRTVFTLTNSVDPDEMWHYAVFHLGCHCLSKSSI